MAPTLPPRLVHLNGGLRAADFRTKVVQIWIAHDIPVLDFATPSYADLYVRLKELGFEVLGVEFLSRQTIEKAQSPDWCVASPTVGFRTLWEIRAWSEVRHAASNDRNLAIRFAAARMKTYLDLLEIRLFDLSNSYNSALRSWYLGGAQRERLHSNGFLSRIDAAVHAFLADACCLRDLLAEIISRSIFNHSKPADKLSVLLGRLGTETHPLAAELRRDTGEGGWIKSLSKIRNNIIHVAPVGRGSSFHDFSIRFHSVPHRPDIEAPTLWYPLLDSEGRLPPVREDPDWNDEDQIRNALDGYWKFHQCSLDGLSYLWLIFDQLVRLAITVRETADFRRETLTITEDDIVVSED